MAGSINASIIAKAVYQQDRKVAEEKRKEFFRKNRYAINPRKKSRWRCGVCKKCDEFFECITFAHAELHGYKTPDEMAKKADFIDWGLY